MTDTATTTATPATDAPATATITPYLAASDAAAAIDWYVAVLGAVEQLRYTGDDGRIGHAELTIGGARFMLSDEYPEFGVPVVSPTTLGGTPFSMHVEVPDVDAVYERVRRGRRRAGRPGAARRGLRRPLVRHDRPVRPPLDDPDPIADPAVDRDRGRHGRLHDHDGGGAVDGRATGRGRLRHVRLARHRRRLAVLRRLVRLAAEAGSQGDEYAHVANTRLPMGLTPGPVDEAPVIYFRVDDIARYAARVRELGGEVVSETTYDSGPNAVCRDDQGREFQLWQPAPGY